MTTRPTPASITSTLTALSETVTADTAATIGDLDLLVKVNKAASTRYRAMGDAAEGLHTDAEYLKGKYAEVEKYIGQVDSLDEKVAELEGVVRELEEWTGELEVKVRRLAVRQ